MRLLALCTLAFSSLAATISVNQDQGRTGWNQNETKLTSSNVAAGKFGKIGTFSTSGYVFAQPLIVPAVTTAGGVKDLLIVATLANNIYAFDANAPGSAAIWSQSFGSGWSGYPDFGSGSPFLYGQSIGILSTPAVNTTTGKVYVVSDDAMGAYTLKVLDLAAGTVLSSTAISGQVVGAGDATGGDTTSGPNLLFYPSKEEQRPGLTLANGNVYLTFGGLGDNHPWHGWIIAYDATTLAQVGIFCTTPNSFGGAMWGGPTAVDGSGNIYITTGNGGNYDGVTTFTNSVLKLTPTLTLLDWFSPSNNNAVLNPDDADVSSNRFLLIPGTTLGVIASKDFNVYLLDTTCMGHLQGSSGCALQTFKTNASGTITAFSGSYGALYINGSLILPTTAGSLYSFAFSAGSFNTTPTATNIQSFGVFGPAQLLGTSNGASDSLIWTTTAAASTFTTVQAGTLRCFNTSLTEIWNSGTNASDSLGNMTKFTSPTSYNGRVYVQSLTTGITVYGLLQTSQSRGQSGLRGVAGLR